RHRRARAGGSGEFEVRPSPAASRHPLPQAGEGSRARALAPRERGEGGPKGRVRGVTRTTSIAAARTSRESAVADWPPPCARGSSDRALMYRRVTPPHHA